MNRKVNVLFNGLRAIEEIDTSVRGDRIDGPDVLTAKINGLIDALGAISEEGSTMDDSSLLHIPLGIFDCVGSVASKPAATTTSHGLGPPPAPVAPAVNNPDLYLIQLLKACDEKSDSLLKKRNYLNELKVLEDSTSTTVPKPV
jgi:hypothetical protein